MTKIEDVKTERDCGAMCPEGLIPDAVALLSHADTEIWVAIEFRVSHPKAIEDVRKYATVDFPDMEISITDDIANAGDTRKSLAERITGTGHATRFAGREWLYSPAAKKILKRSWHIEAEPSDKPLRHKGTDLVRLETPLPAITVYRDHPFIVYSYGDGACFHDDVEFDSLRTAISYASQLHSGAIDPDYLRVEYTHDEYETLCWRDFYQAAHGNIEYASRLVDQCNGGFREGFGPYACAAEDLAEGEIVNFNNCYVITDANGPDTKEIAAKRIWDELGDVCIDDNECIDSEFYGYPIGTFREDIWHDIEDQLGVPIHELMFPDNANKDMTNERSLAMSNENKNTNVKEETTWTNFKFFNNQVKLKVIEKDDRQMYLADCRFMPGSVANGIDLGDQNGISGHMTVFLTEKQYFKAAEQKANGEQINVGLPSTQLKDGKIEVNFYNHESKEAHTIQVNPFAASKANKAAREAFFERKDAEREQGKSLGAKAASARGASEKLDGQSQTAPAKDNLEH